MLIILLNFTFITLSAAKQLIIAVKWKILRARKSNIFVNRGLGSDCRTQRQLAPNWNLKNQKINKHADTPPTSTTNEPKTSQSMTLEQLAAPKRAHALLRCFSQKPARTLPTRNQIKERANCRIDDMCVWWLFLACGLLCGVTFGHLLAKRALAFAIYARRKSHGEESSGSSRSLKSGEVWWYKYHSCNISLKVGVHSEEFCLLRSCNIPKLNK